MEETIRGRIYKCPYHLEEWKDEDKWAFRSECWEKAELECVNLTSIHRQTDKKFIAILEKCRTGQTLSEQDINTLLNHKCNVRY
jgi:ATP-dependent DNA helicase PIF1